MRMIVVVCSTILIGTRPAHAQDAESRQTTARDVCTFGKVDYWRSAEAKRPARAPEAQSVWVEPIRMPDGRYAPYVPAPEVLQFLEDPSVETAERYLAWQRARASKLRRAMEILQQLAPGETSVLPDEGEPKAPEKSAAPRKIESEGTPKIELLYFKQTSCRYCDAQDRVLKDLRARQPGVSIREIARGERADLWQRHQVKVTPTLVVTADSDARAVLRGLTALDAIESALKEATACEK